MSRHIAAVAGATGLTGRYLVELLSEDAYYDGIVTLARRARPEAVHPKIEWRAIGPSDLDLSGATHLFCCLGTTIKKAGSKEAFRAVDYDLALQFAKRGREAGARRLMLVSSVGADVESSTFYLSVKGELERDVCTLGFEAVHIFRPSILLGPRDESRPAEEWGKRLSIAFEWMLAGGLRKYRPMPAGVLAAAMAAAGERGGEGVRVLQYDEIKRLARG